MGHSDIATIKERLVALYASGPFANASRDLASQKADGSWSDINYADRSLNWDPQKHLDRLKEMAVGYRSGRSPDRGAPSMRDGILRGLAFWYASKPAADNWWSNEIGQQLALEPILVLLAADLSPALLQSGISYLHDPVERASLKFTGQNLMWSAAEQLVRGVLRESSQDITDAVHAMASVETVTADAEGIQYDHSFHQHGPQLYVGGYGLNLLKDATAYARLAEGTQFAFGADRINVLSDYVLDGARLMVRGRMLDLGAIGREIARPGASEEAVGLIPVLDNMAVLIPEKKRDYDALKMHIQRSGAPYGFIGHKHFWDSDFSTHQRQGYYTSVKMVSARTYGTETINGENVKGYWLPFGTNLVARRGDEYLDIFPVWDWAHLPGVTSPDQVPRFLSHVQQPNTFVGGVSDGVYGAAAMKVDVDSETSIHAHKAWFFFDDEFVALGSGISSAASAPVSTTLNQSLERGDVVVEGRVIPAGKLALHDPKWIFHDGVGYVFPKAAAVSVSAGPRTGRWSDINSLQATTPVTKSVFALWLDHGVRPNDAAYQYIVVPGRDANGVAAYAGHIPVRVLANTTSVQAVRHDGLRITEIIFYTPGRLSIRDGLAIAADQPCMVLSRETGHGVDLALSAPRGPIQIHLSLELSNRTTTETFDLRGGPSLGASQLRSVNP